MLIQLFLRPSEEELLTQPDKGRICAKEEKMCTFGRTVAGIFIALVLTVSGFAQTASTGTILGVVSDPSGAVVPAVTVELQDVTTRSVRSVTTNEVGRYLFVGVSPGTYSLRATAAGFKNAEVVAVTVEVTRSYTIDFKLEIGAARQTVQVTAASAAELQTLDSTVGSSLGGNMLLLMPTQLRDVTNLLMLQPMASPQTNVSTTNGGQVAGARSDQNFFMLDGGDITNGTSANSDYLAVTGLQEGAMPTPVESIEEFRVATSNPNASFTGSSGGEIMMVTKRGSDTFHGSAYEFLQNSDLNANTWSLNRAHQKRPQSRDNRFGASFGGYLPGLPDKAKTYFYGNYEGRRQAAGSSDGATVPTASLRQGILKFADASGAVDSYNLASSTACGPTGTSACDPRGLGMNPEISQLWSKYLPTGNTSGGDGLNTTGFTAGMVIPDSSDFAVVRVDHSFGQKWQLMTSYRYFTEFPANTAQIDIGGLEKGDTNGIPSPSGHKAREPRYFVANLTGALSPSLTSETSFSYLRDWWQWITAGALPQVSGTSGALGGNLIVPLSLSTYSARQRAWDDHREGIRENLSWQKKTHLLRFGGTYERSQVWFWRDDANSTLTHPIYNIATLTGVNIANTYRPPTCAGAGATNCLPSSQAGNWNSFYAQTLGMIDSGTQFMTRAANLTAYPPGTPLSNDVTYSTSSLFATDTWHIRPTVTATYGVNWTADMPPYETQGKQIMAVNASNGSIIEPTAYLSARYQAALNGQVYNPVLGFEPISNTHRKYPFDPVYNDFSPRVALAWNPRVTGGPLERLLGGDKTVIRGGFVRLFDRLNGVQKAIDPLQGFGYGQSQVCLGPSSGGSCLGSSATTPSTAFRIGTDGSTVPIPGLSTAVLPFIPGNSAVSSANQAFANSTYNIDPSYVPSPNNQLNVSVQRALPNNSILEIGYTHRSATKLYAPVDLDQSPYMMKYGGQSFAQAFDNVMTALRAGTTPSAQAFFESALAGSSVCTTTCTAGVASAYGSSFLSLNTFNLWNALQPRFVFGAATPATTQTSTVFFYSDRGYSNYDAGFLSYRIRNWKNLSVETNLTYGHSLDTSGVNQNIDTTISNAYVPSYDYGVSYFDRKFVYNLLAYYQVPFGRHGGNAYLNKVIRGWSVSPVFTWSTGLPLEVSSGSCQWLGQGNDGTCTDAVMIAKNTWGHQVHAGATGNSTTQVGIQANPATGGTGLSLFADPNAVYNSFRYPLMSEDTTSRGGGPIFGQNRWNLDMDLARKINVTERVSVRITADFFNIFNKVQFSDPGLSLTSPQSFGVIGGQYGSPRIIEFGMHLDF